MYRADLRLGKVIEIGIDVSAGMQQDRDFQTVDVFCKVCNIRQKDLAEMIYSKETAVTVTQILADPHSNTTCFYRSSGSFLEIIIGELEYIGD
jgi:hypothetical protein